LAYLDHPEEPIEEDNGRRGDRFDEVAMGVKQ
jgi:hypothetical protein